MSISNNHLPILDAVEYVKGRETLDITVSRMKCSSCILDLVEIDDYFYFDFPGWTPYWTKKYRTLSEVEFSKWAQKKIRAYIESYDVKVEYEQKWWLTQKHRT